MCVHRTQCDIRPIAVPKSHHGKLRTSRIIKTLKVMIKESGSVIAIWLVLNFLIKLAKATPLIQENAGGGGVWLHESDGSDEIKPVKGNTNFFSGFVSSLSMIIVSELGDKTFFIAAVMAMKHPRLTVFMGAITALAFMTVLSALFGFVTTFIPRVYTYYISTALFAIFGFKMLYDGILMTDDEAADELEEVQMDLRQREEDENTPLTTSSFNENVSPGGSKTKVHLTIRRILTACFSKVYIQALTMTFLAEWGDRSQLATVVLAARENILGICVGGVLGHSLCTGLAVIGGRMIAQKISVKTVTIIGGFVFLGFAVVSLFLDPN